MPTTSTDTTMTDVTTRTCSDVRHDHRMRRHARPSQSPGFRQPSAIGSLLPAARYSPVL